MEIKEMNMADVESRMAEIHNLLNSEDADIEKLNAEVDELITRKKEITEKANAEKELRAKVTSMNVAPIAKIEERKTNTMDIEKRELIYDALAETIKGHATPEQRALLTENVSGTVTISKVVDDYVWTNWEKSGILAGITKRYVPGNYAVNYEATASGAVKHTEGTDAPAEETLTLGVINFIANYYKKWLDVSDSVMALRGRAFLDYLHDEFDAKLANALEDATVAEIEASALTVSVTHAIDKGAIIAGLAQLSEEARNPVVILSRANWATIKADALSAGFAFDPFEGMTVLFNSSAAGILIGDLGGVVANFPEGEDFKFIVDELSQANKDMVRITGKILADIHLVRPAGFVLVKNA